MKKSYTHIKRCLYMIICSAIFILTSYLILEDSQYHHYLFFQHGNSIWTLIACILWFAVIFAFIGIAMSILSIIKKDSYKKVKHIIVGLIPLMLNTIWFYLASERLYGQNGGGILYIIHIPEWIIALNITGATIGIILSIMIMRKQILIYKSIFINFILFIILFVITFLDTMF